MYDYYLWQLSLIRLLAVTHAATWCVSRVQMAYFPGVRLIAAACKLPHRSAKHLLQTAGRVLQ